MLGANQGQASLVFGDSAEPLTVTMVRYRFWYVLVRPNIPHQTQRLDVGLLSIVC
jgi:hypothetical protein